MGFWDFIFGWKVINDQDKEDLTEEDELMDMMYIVDDIKNKEKANENKNKKDDKWW